MIVQELRNNLKDYDINCLVIDTRHMYNFDVDTFPDKTICVYTPGISHIDTDNAEKQIVCTNADATIGKQIINNKLLYTVSVDQNSQVANFVEYLVLDMLGTDEFNLRSKEIVKRKLSQTVVKMLETQKKAKEDRLRALENNRKSYLDSIQSLTREILAARAELNHDIVIKDYQARIEKELNLITQHEMTDRVHFTGESTLVIYTKDIITTEHYTGRKYFIGQMKIELPFTTNGTIKIYNANPENVRDGYWQPSAFPHINQANGYICWGNTDAQICTYMSEEEFYAVYMTILSYLQYGVDIDDCAGWYLSEWDEVEVMDDGSYVVINEGHKPSSDEYEGYGCNSGYCTCERCGDSIEEDEEFTCNECGHTFCGDCITWHDSLNCYLCDDCEDRHYCHCDHCGELHHRDDLTYVESTNKEVCKYCLEEHYNTCDDCGELYLSEHMYVTHDGRPICSGCYDAQYTTCDDCGEVVETTNAYFDENNSTWYCNDCWNNKNNTDTDTTTKSEESEEE